MKKFTAFFIFFLFFSLITFAQVKIGPKAGLNIANLSGDDISDADSRTGFSGGLFLTYQVSDMFAIQPEAYYSMKGATYSETYSGYTYKLTYSLDYIEIPVLLKLMIPLQGSTINPAIFAGPAVGFNTTHKVKVEVDNQSVEQDIEDIKSTDFSLVFGGGIGFPVGQNEIGFDVRYILGLGTVDDSGADADVKNSVINFNVFFGFSLN